ncbi:MAG: acetyl-CoA carboxylase biotin carboxyl carrier protein, partial [Pseudoalteromonas marina]
MDIRKIKKLIELVEESGIAELEITEGEESVRINRHSSAPMAAPVHYAAAPAAAPVAAPAAAPVAAEESAAPAVVSGHQVKSPMVGTFYRASSPEAASYV